MRLIMMLGVCPSMLSSANGLIIGKDSRTRIKPTTGIFEHVVAVHVHFHMLGIGCTFSRASDRLHIFYFGLKQNTCFRLLLCLTFVKHRKD